MGEWVRAPFGFTAGGEEVSAWTIRAGGYSARVLSYGGVLQSFSVPAPEGERDIVLGFDTLAEYEAQNKYIGALVGRVANRIGGASFTLGGVRYPLAANSGPNCLHGGRRGFDRAVWRGEARGELLVLTHRSPDGEEGFPGALEAEVSYSLSPAGELTIRYFAKSDRDTLCSLTNHSYFNLAGHGAGSLAGQSIRVNARAITPIDQTGVPTGELMPVEGTPFDLTRGRPFLEGLAESHPQLALGSGYDHNFALHSHPAGPLAPAAEVRGAGLVLTCETTQPGMQLYTANFLAGERGKGGACYGPRSAFCLEAQGWPDAIHHPGFPSPVLRAGEEYRHTTLYRAVREGK